MCQSENVEKNKWGLGKIDVKANMPLIKAKLEAGHSVSSVYRELKKKSAVNISRYQFSVHVKRLIREALSTPSSKNRSIKRSKLPTERGSERSFKHSPLPDESLLEELGLSRAKRGDR